MIHLSKHRDERRDASGPECWFLHGAVGSVSDWRSTASVLASKGMATRAVDLWRFLECESLPMDTFASQFNAEAIGEVQRGQLKILIGYSMGGRLALHSLLQPGSPWDAAIIISAHPGLADPAEQAARRSEDASWAFAALTGKWDEFIDKWHARPILADSIPRDPREDAKLVQRRREIARSLVDWSLGSQADLRPQLPSVSIPTLWIAGENDLKFHQLATEAVALNPRFALATAPGCGHRIPWQNPTWFTDTLARFASTLHA